MHVLIATDAQWVLDDVVAALGSPSTTFHVVTDGRQVSPTVAERVPDIAIVDLQVGTMGGMAITMDLRLDHSSGAVPHVPILMLLDRTADVHLARRSGANGWIIKPLDSLRLRRAVQAVAGGGTYTEGTVPSGPAIGVPDAEPADAATQTADSLG